LFDARDLAEITAPIIRVSAWWCAAIRCSPMSEPQARQLLDAREKLIPHPGPRPARQKALRGKARSRSGGPYRR